MTTKSLSGGLLLALAYATTIGGMSTIIGTPPNVLLAGFMEETYGIQIAFFDWMLIGLPFALVLLPLGWVVSTRVAFRVDVPASPEVADVIHSMREEMGNDKSSATRGAAFSHRRCSVDGEEVAQRGTWFRGLSDAGIVMAAALLLFVIPSGRIACSIDAMGRCSAFALGVLILFGGGLALAAQVSGSGLAVWLGESLLPVAGLGTLVLVAARGSCRISNGTDQ